MEILENNRFIQPIATLNILDKIDERYKYSHYIELKKARKVSGPAFIYFIYYLYVYQYKSKYLLEFNQSLIQGFGTYRFITDTLGKLFSNILFHHGINQTKFFDYYSPLLSVTSYSEAINQLGLFLTKICSDIPLIETLSHLFSEAVEMIANDGSINYYNKSPLYYPSSGRKDDYLYQYINEIFPCAYTLFLDQPHFLKKIESPKAYKAFENLNIHLIASQYEDRIVILFPKLKLNLISDLGNELLLNGIGKYITLLDLIHILVHDEKIINLPSIQIESLSFLREKEIIKRILKEIPKEHLASQFFYDLYKQFNLKDKTISLLLDNDYLSNIINSKISNIKLTNTKKCVKCYICIDNKNSIQLKICNHNFCLKCFNEEVSAFSQNTKRPLAMKCPVSDCFTIVEEKLSKTSDNELLEKNLKEKKCLICGGSNEDQLVNCHFSHHLCKSCGYNYLQFHVPSFIQLKLKSKRSNNESIIYQSHNMGYIKCPLSISGNQSNHRCPYMIPIVRLFYTCFSIDERKNMLISEISKLSKLSKIDENSVLADNIWEDNEEANKCYHCRRVFTHLFSLHNCDQNNCIYKYCEECKDSSEELHKILGFCPNCKKLIKAEEIKLDKNNNEIENIREKDLKDLKDKKGYFANDKADSKDPSICSFCQKKFNEKNSCTRFSKCKTSNCQFAVCKNDLSELLEMIKENEEPVILPCSHSITLLEIGEIKQMLNLLNDKS